MQESRKKEIRIKTDSFREKCKVSRYGIIDLFKECERRGYKLFRYPLGEEADLGFTLRKDNDTIIFTNTCSRLAREIFTLAHEIGHLYGLHHVFGEKSTGNSSAYTCDADDYCNDTPNYDRNVYMANIETFGYMRQPCTGGALFRSSNIMDYYFSDLNSLTNDQRTRIQYVLEHGIYAPPGNATLYSVYSLPYADEPPHIMLR